MKLVHVFVILGLAAIGLALWIPSRPSPDTQGKFHVSEAATLLGELARAVEAFYQQHGRLPVVSELKLNPTSGEFVEGLTGNNPYFAHLRIERVYPAVAGKTLGWFFDPATGQWDECSFGTVEVRFKPLRCRETSRRE